MQAIAQTDPKIIVSFLPMRSDMIPVGISKMADEAYATENILIPNAYEPVTFAKYMIATGAKNTKSVKKLCNPKSLIFRSIRFTM